MNALLIFAIVILIVQVLLFISIRSKKRKIEFPSEIERKYRISTRADAWKLLNNPDLSEAERKEIENIYKNME